MQVNVIKGRGFVSPGLETEDLLMMIGGARSSEDTSRIANREPSRWMRADDGFGEINARMLVSQAGRIRLGNMVDAENAVAASISKKYLVS